MWAECMDEGITHTGKVPAQPTTGGTQTMGQVAYSVGPGAPHTPVRVGHLPTRRGAGAVSRYVGDAHANTLSIESSMTSVVSTGDTIRPSGQRCPRSIRAGLRQYDQYVWRPKRRRRGVGGGRARTSSSPQHCQSPALPHRSPLPFVTSTAPSAPRSNLPHNRNRG